MIFTRIALLVVVALLSHLPYAAMTQTHIIIKLDDLGVADGRVTAPAAMDYLARNGIKAGLGVIADQLDSSAAGAYEGYLAARAKDGTPVFEIWNHGLDHSNNNTPENLPEFKGTSYEFQLSHLQRAHELVKQLLAVEMRTFGSPYNASDENTMKALSALDGYRVFLFSGANNGQSGKIDHFNNRVNMEVATGKVDYENFLKEYIKYKDQYLDVMVLQGHPNRWDEQILGEFDKIVRFLLSEGCKFILPYEYYLKKHKSEK